jgi:hypothetical protein
MSQWGKRERINIPNAITANLNSRTVTAAAGSGAFGNVRVYDSIALGNVIYKVANVVSNVQITLDVPFETANVNLSNSYIRQTPKDLTTYGWGNVTTGANTINLRNVYGVSRTEAANTQNKAKGMTHTGWVKYNTYTTTQGQVRNKVEVLVAMSKNFNANVSGNVYPDAEDNTVIFSGGGDGV